MTDAEPHPGRTGWLVMAVAVALLAALVLLVMRSEAPADGPQPIVWDEETCAHCLMHIGEPAFAAQLQTTDGRILNFDDPGCLMEYRAAQRPDVRAIYYHHAEEDRWLTESEVGFIEVAHSPMGYGLAAVGAERPGALSLDAARQRVLVRSQGPVGRNGGD